MSLNICSKNEVLEHFNLWLLDKYNYLGNDQIGRIMLKADDLLSNDDDLDYYAIEGHRVLYRAITGA